MLIGDILQKQAEEKSNHPFIILEEKSYTFREFNQIVNKAAVLLKRDFGVENGTHVSIILPNNIDFLVLFFAIAKLGGVVVPMNPLFKSDMLSYMVNQSKSSVLIHHKDGERFNTLNNVKKMVIDNGDILHLIRNIQEEDFVNTDIKPSSIFSIIYTSGTTSKPKGVVSTHKAYISAGKDMVEALHISEDDITYLFLPLFHANPQFYGIMSALIAGNTLLIDKKFSAKEFWEKVQNNRFTIFTYVGTVLAILLKTVPARITKKSLIRGVGGGAPRETWEQLTARSGIKINELYGMSETAGFVTINSEKDWKLGSVGKARDCVEIALLNENDEKCKVGEIGEISIRPKEPDVLFNGYFNEPEKTLEVFSNLWFHTGDLGWIDQDGFLYFEGRKKDIIRKKGENISPTYIEEVFQRLDEVKEAACVGIPDEIVGEEIKLCIVMEEKDFRVEKLLDYGKKQLPEMMLPRYFERMNHFPKTPTEKVEKHKLKYLDKNVVDMKGCNHYDKSYS